MSSDYIFFSFFFFNDTATTEIYTLSLHDALPISSGGRNRVATTSCWAVGLPLETSGPATAAPVTIASTRSEEHTSELQSRLHLVCRLLLEKKKKNNNRHE